jgi:hypothetical protein
MNFERLKTSEGAAPQVAVIDSRSQPFPAYDREPLRSQRLTPIDVYELASTDLGAFVGLIIGGSADQEYLLRNKVLIDRFLDDGKTLVFSGHLFREWLPGCGVFVPKAIDSVDDYTVTLEGDHPVFDGVDPADLTFRRGVAGFFARGHHPPPPGAQVLARLGGGEPVVYVDRSTTNGVILAHSGNDLLGFADGGTAARIVPQLVDWIRQGAPA